MIVVEIAAHNFPQVDLIQRKGYAVNLHEGADLFTRIFTCENSVCLGAYSDDVMIGYIVGYPTNRSCRDFETGPVQCDNPDVMYLHDMCIDPDYQGRGIGADLFDTFQRKVKILGYAGIIATALEGRLSFWQRLGFSATEEKVYRGVPSTHIARYFGK